MMVSVWLGAMLALVGAGMHQNRTGPPGYCAFEVNVKSSRNQPVANAPVTMFDASEQKFSTVVTDRQGVARMCDAPPGLIRFTVGGLLCGEASVGQLRRYWMQTRRVTITYDNCNGEEWAPLGGCMLTLRVRASDGAPLAGARVEGDSLTLKSREQILVSDSWGRAFLFLEFGDRLNAMVLSEGYVSRPVVVECKRGESFDRDLIVELDSATVK